MKITTKNIILAGLIAICTVICLASLIVNISIINLHSNENNEKIKSNEMIDDEKPGSGIYATAGYVIGVYYNTDTVLFETGAGITYAFYGTEDWQPHDVVAALMSDAGTPGNVYDDEIIAVRYSGLEIK